MKHIIPIVLIVALMSLAFVSCGKKDASTDEPQATNAENVYADDSTSSEAPSKNFSKEELAKYDGKNNNAAYISINGIVYDITNSKEWKESKYKTYQPGKDYTDVEIEDELLNKLTVVGAYGPAFSETDDQK